MIKLHVSYNNNKKEVMMIKPVSETKTGLFKIRLKGFYFYVRKNKDNEAFLKLCSKCLRVLLFDQDEFGQETLKCYDCEYRDKELMEKLIYLGQTSAEYREAKGFSIAKHTKHKMQIFKRNIQPFHIGTKNQKVFTGWRILKCFSFENGRWKEEIDVDFFKKFREDWGKEC